LDAICAHPILYASPMVANFLGSFTETYIDLHEWILLSFRDKRDWALEQQRKQCGWRAGKVHYEVRSGRSRLLLSGIRYGPDRFGSPAELNTALEFLHSLQCPYLNESVASWATDAGILYVRPIFKNGTLRDQLYKVCFTEC
uniref:PAS domain-containing protein n=1 Tax=Gongylonema pulchrum TaxID=637853 RepID=A0A183DAZ6_9BILA